MPLTANKGRIRYNLAMDTEKPNPPKTGLTDSRMESPATLNVPNSGELYRYLCPVDHQNNLVAMRGLRSKNGGHHPAILIIHDVGERSDMYWDCIRFLCEQGFSSYSYDQRGHGADADISGHLDRFQDLVGDLLQVASWVRHMHNGISPIIVGQGYGAIVANEFAAKYPLLNTGVVLAAPTLELAWTPGPIKRYIIKVMSEVAPRIKVPKGLHPRFSNPLHREVGKTLATRFIQSLIGPRQLRLTFAFARELFEAMDSFSRHFQLIKNPVLILKPGNDEVARFDSIEKIAATHRDKSIVTSRTVANVHHNGFTEGNLPMASILDEVLSWSKAVASKAGIPGAKGPHE
jgi:alpha-beta hydrolase superfamily lysophospholipase